MADRTDIEWTDATWPVITGCLRCSPGCEKCYAERLTGTRLRNHPKYKGLTRKTVDGPRFNGEVRFNTQDLDLPLRWRRPRRVFVCDMSDLFYGAVPSDWIQAVFGVMASAPQHTFQVLSKRAARLRHFTQGIVSTTEIMDLLYAAGAVLDREVNEDLLYPPWPLPNVWLGVSVEDREHGLPRIDQLRQTPAALRFVSIEPLLEDLGTLDLAGIGWVIVGGESGPRARPCSTAWVHGIVDQCRQASVPVFVKQLGSFPVYGSGNWPRHLRNSKGADPADWPEHLRIREFPK